MAERLSIDAGTILKLIEQRHGRDVFFSEVKDGATWNGRHLRLDALAIRRTWSPPRLIGYEIKSSRGDWLRDEKWEGYLAVTHEFWIAAPKGVVRPEELPDSVGLLEVASTGSMLRIAKKSAYRPIELPGRLMLYLLMSRTRPSATYAESLPTRDERIAAWKTRLEAGQSIDYSIKNKIRERLSAAEGVAKRVNEVVELERWLREHDPYSYGSLLQRVCATLARPSKERDEAAANLVRAAERVVKLLAPETPPRDGLAHQPTGTES